MDKIMTAKAERELNSELVSETLGVDGEQKLDPITDAILRALDTTVARRIVGLEPLVIDPLTGLVLDSRPDLVGERTGLEELDVQEIHRHRYSGQYPGDPRSHYLGGSDDITFGNDGSEISESWERMKDHVKSTREEKHWREAYHQVGFIADQLNLPEPVREDICRAYANLREQEISEAYSLENLLGLLAYVACRVHGYSRNFNDVKRAIDELYGVTVSKDNLTRNMVQAFNKGPIRFGMNDQNGYRYLHTWKMINSEKVDHRSLGSL